jgi:hypothetical protein
VVNIGQDAASAPSGASLPVDGGYQDVTLTFTGLPDHVALGDLEVRYDLPLASDPGGGQGNNGSGEAFVKFTRVFLLDAQPVGLQQIPWADFLEYTCRWAWGAAGANDLKEKMTRGMHYSNRSADARLWYGPFQSNYTYYYVPTNPFVCHSKLGQFTYDMQFNSDPWVVLDCADFATLLELASRSQGHPLTAVRQDPQDLQGFVTNKMCKAGNDSTDIDQYEEFPFNFHVVNWWGAYDASSSYLKDLGGANYMNPPVDWSNLDHWQIWAAGAWQGLVKHGPRPRYATILEITYVDPNVIQ